MTRKVYVLGYRPKEDEDDKWLPPPKPWRVEDYVMGCSAGPEWTFPDRSLAEDELVELRKMGFHFGEHYCDFAVETLDDGEFALVCLSHPAELKLAGKPV